MAIVARLALLVVVAMAAAVSATALPRSVLDAYYRPVPSAGYVRKDCVHSVPSGSSLQRLAQGGVRVTPPNAASYHLPPCPSNASLPTFAQALPADYDGWLAYTAYNISTSFQSFTGYMSTPNVPKSAPQVLYLFTGLQNIDWVPLVDPESKGQHFDIIQPVLQYPGDAGLYWSVRSWYVTLDTGAIASTEVQLKPGDKVFGNMTQIGQEQWLVDSVAPSGRHTSITPTAQRLARQPWAYNVMEAYSVSGCNDYPTDDSIFTNLILFNKAGTKVSPVWRLNPKPDTKHFCKETVQILNAGSMQFSFQ